MLSYKSFEQIVSNIIDKLGRNTPITDFSAGSIARAIVEAFADELAAFYRMVDVNLAQGFVSTSSGRFLELIGRLLGVARQAGETDENLRYRIVHRWEEAATSNELAVRMAVLAVPGVSDVMMKPYVLGSGSFAVYPVPEPGISAESLIEPIEQALDGAAGYGTRALVSMGEERSIELELELTLDPTVATVRRDQLLDQAREEAIAYIDSLGLGDPFVITQLTHRIHDLSDEGKEIRDVRIASLIVDGSPVLIQNLIPEWDERFVPSSVLTRVA